MKKTLTTILTIIISLLLVYFSLHILSLLFIPKWLTTDDNMHSYISKGFYAEEKNSLDVLFMGNSDIYRGISPMELYDEYGIKSYGYTSAGQRMWTAYYMLKEALRYQKPKVIVLGVDSLFNESNSSISNYRKVFDQMKNSKVKYEALNDSIYDFDFSTRLSFYFPVFKYHTRYSELTKDDFKYAFSDFYFDYKGLDLNKEVVPYNNGFSYMDESEKVVTIPKKVLTYMNKIINLCKDNNINLVFVELPSADSWSYEKSMATYEYAKKNNIPFLDLNLNSDDFAFDWTTDSSDGGDHLNVYGAKKVTRYLGKYLNENYTLKDCRKDSNSKKWNRSLEIYKEASK